MAARDKFHPHFKNALINDGWTITQDPLLLPFGTTNLQVDLGAEKLIAAHKGTQKIAVEVKSFLSQSNIADLQDALGQFLMYDFTLQSSEPDRELWLAIPEIAYNNLFSNPAVEALRVNFHLKMIVYDPSKQELIKWIP
jgi:XisH protein